MKKIKLTSQLFAFVFKQNEAIDFFKPKSTQYLWFQEIEYLNVDNVHVLKSNMEDFLLGKKGKEHFDMISIRDNEIALVFKKGNLQSVLTTGEYFKAKFAKNIDIKILDKKDWNINNTLPIHLLNHALMSPHVFPYLISSNEKGLLFNDQIFLQEIDSGQHYFWKQPLSISILKTDMRNRLFSVTGQEVLTKDKTTLRINADITYKVDNLKQALIKNQDYEKQLHIQCQFAIRQYISNKNLDDVLADKKEISNEIFEFVKQKSIELGLVVIDFGLKDLILPGEMRIIMNEVLLAQKRAEANLITRREETASTRNLLNTAKLMESNPMLFKLKEMEYIEKIAEKVGEISVTGQSNILGQLKTILTK